jgi:hypothetical protein
LFRGRKQKEGEVVVPPKDGPIIRNNIYHLPPPPILLPYHHEPERGYIKVEARHTHKNN